MHIVDCNSGDQRISEEMASLLVEGFQHLAPSAWPDLESARAEVRDALEPGRVCRAALGDDGTVLGWIGGIPEYGGRVWEVHPLVVAAAFQGRGIGRALVADLEARSQERGGLTLFLGTDDEMGADFAIRSRPVCPLAWSACERSELAPTSIRVLSAAGLHHRWRRA